MNKKWLVIGSCVLAGGLLIAAIVKYRKKLVDMGVDYVLSENQKSAMSKLHKTAQAPFHKLIAEIEKRGYKVLVTSGYRTWAEQDKQHQINPTKVPPAGGGYHNYGMALDINLLKDGKQWKMATPTADWLKTGIPQLAEKMGFTWGGRFNNYPDHVHFDYRKYDSKELKKLALAQFGKNPAYIEGNKVKIA
jgi:hypothetical protein